MNIYLNTSGSNRLYIAKLTGELAASINKNVVIEFVNGVHWQGCCHKDKHLIRYSTEKVDRYPLEALRNLAIHEVCHLKYANHSKRFRNLCRKMGITEKYWLYGAPKKTPRPTYMKDL